MSKYQELKEKIDELQKEANAAFAVEQKDAISEIVKKMEVYRITIEQLAEIVPKRNREPKLAKAKGPKSNSAKEPKFKDPNGSATWTGGPGRKPKWFVDAVARGVDEEDMKIKKAATAESGGTSTSATPEPVIES